MNLRDKVGELIAAAESNAAFAATLDDQASAYLDQFGGWPVSTQVPLVRVATILASLALEPTPSVRRVRVTDGMELRSQLG